MSRYLKSMAIRTVCVLLVVVVPGPARWLFAAGAVGLPYVAVVMANARRSGRDADPIPTPPRGAVGAAPSEPATGHDRGEYRQRDQADTEELYAECRERLVRDQDERALAHGTEEQDDAFARAACQPTDAQYPPDIYGHGDEYQAGQDRADSGQRGSE